MLTEKDLGFLVSLLAPGSDPGRMIRTLREDEEILSGMLADPRLIGRFLDPATPILTDVSPALFFGALLARVKKDLERETWTLERSGGMSMVLFDTPKIVELLDDSRLRAYLTGLLASFVKLNSFSTSVRIRPGIWRRVHFSDFDIDSLARYAATLSERERFPLYRRIADICLFTLGVFSPLDEPQPGLHVRSTRTRDDYIAEGVAFYTRASKHEQAREGDLEEVLSILAEKFTLAAKPLTVMSSRYLEQLKDDMTP